MIALTVLYPKSETSHFDHDYYLNSHIPLVRERFTSMGLTNVHLYKGTATLEGSAPHFEMVGLLEFSSVTEMSAALATHGAEVVGDIPNFTNVQPLIQVSDKV